MAKIDTVKDIKAANGQDAPEALTQKQLDELLVIAERDGADNTTAFSAKLTEFQGAASSTGTSSTTTVSTPKAKTISVRVNDTIAAYGGEFTDPDTRAVIGKEAVSVPHSAFVKEKLRSDEIVEAD